jgi:hypothetical protein
MRKQPQNVLSHWQTAYEGFSTPVQEFYAQVEEAVRSRRVTDVAFSRVVYKEGGIGSAGREYLRVSRGGLVVDICAAPCGTGFFFSSWMALDFPRILPHLYLLFILGLGTVFLYLGVPGVVDEGTFTGLFGFGAAYLALLGILGVAVHRRVIGVEAAAEAMPLYLGKVYSLFFNPGTYFSIDTESMFQTAVHAAVLEAVRAVTEESGHRVIVVPERRVA